MFQQKIFYFIYVYLRYSNVIVLQSQNVHKAYYSIEAFLMENIVGGGHSRLQFLTTHARRSESRSRSWSIGKCLILVCDQKLWPRLSYKIIQFILTAHAYFVHVINLFKGTLVCSGQTFVFLLNFAITIKPKGQGHHSVTCA